jgi:archaellum component FlaC
MDKEIKKEFGKLSKQISSVKQDLQKEILGVKQGLQSQITGVKQDLQSQITGVKQDLQSQITGVKSFLYKEIPTKQEMEDRFTKLPTKQDFNILQTSVDAYAKQSKDYYQEVTVVVAKVNRIEAWIKTASAKIGVEYKI